MRPHPDILSAQAITRLQGREVILKGYDNKDIVGVTVRCVNQWRTTLHEHNDDLHSLVRQKGSGRTPRLTDEQKQQIKAIVLAGFPDERWTSKRIAAVMPVVQPHQHRRQELGEKRSLVKRVRSKTPVSS